MNFFQHQDVARKRTRLLVILLLLAVTTLILVTVWVIAVGFYFYSKPEAGQALINGQGHGLLQHFADLLLSDVGLWTTLAVVTVVLMGSAYKWLEIRAGGSAVAEALGGVPISPNTTDAAERKILNVVEEMAIASGSPVPEVYVIDDNCINAFAAGYTLRDAVIGVTRGCINHLTRDELQGVVAHEFSHIYNGDMRLNMRLVALLHGILLIGLIGHFIVRGSAVGRSRKSDGRAILAGFALMAIGYGGTFFGGLIKAAVSRQREFLADASAVQFTRNPDGIGNALKKIGGHLEGSRFLTAEAETYNHLYFGQSMEPSFLRWTNTHPPLAERIQRIQPNWDQQYITPDRGHVGVYAEDYQGMQKKSQAGMDVVGAVVTGAVAAASMQGTTDQGTLDQPHHGGKPIEFTLDSIADDVGAVTPQQIATADAFIDGLPEALHAACHEPYLARAVIYGLLLSGDAKIKASQLAFLQQSAHPATYKQMETICKLLALKEEWDVLSIVHLCMPALRRMSDRQYDVFSKNCRQLIAHDKVVDFTEWCLYILLFTHRRKPYVGLGKSLGQLKKPLLVMLTVLAEHGQSIDPLQALNAGLTQLSMRQRQDFPQQLVSIQQLEQAVESLRRLRPLHKPVVLKAMVASINADGIVQCEEQLMLRAVAELLDCPLPPLVS